MSQGSLAERVTPSGDVLSTPPAADLGKARVPLKGVYHRFW